MPLTPFEYEQREAEQLNQERDREDRARFEPLAMSPYPRIPQYIRRKLDDYAQNHQPIGGFLTAVLGNDLQGAVCRADEDSLYGLLDIVHYVYNELPSTCWGSPEKVKAWLEKKP